MIRLNRDGSLDTSLGAGGGGIGGSRTLGGGNTPTLSHLAIAPRLNAPKLAPGSYRLAAVPSAGGKNGHTASTGFRIS